MNGFKVKLVDDQLIVEPMNEPNDINWDKIICYDDIVLIYIEAINVSTAKRKAMEKISKFLPLLDRCQVMLETKPLVGVKIDECKKQLLRKEKQ